MCVEVLFIFLVFPDRVKKDAKCIQLVIGIDFNKFIKITFKDEK